MTTTPDAPLKTNFINAAPFWISLSLVPFPFLAATFGGWTLLLLPVLIPSAYALIDTIVGTDKANADPNGENGSLYWYWLITLVWVPVQFIIIFGTLLYATNTPYLSGLGEWALFVGLGFITGAIGINYSHELMHQKPKMERWAGDLLLAMVLYSHFRSEHLLVHHRYVGTPRDPVTARFNEGFWRFFARVVRQCWRSAFNAEKAMLARKKLAWTDPTNPFWRYWALQAIFLSLAAIIGGWWGVFLFFTQATTAIYYLEMINYIEHYGLTRKHLGEGKYEHIQPHHSWNADPKVSNWLLINLQRHSDHHYKPDRRFPLLQTYDKDTAPQLPYGYPVMGFVSLIPPLWKRIMNPRVKAWRAQHYPDIIDWSAYNTASNPLPR